jgi:hypothetical protein
MGVRGVQTRQDAPPPQATIVVENPEPATDLPEDTEIGKGDKATLQPSVALRCLQILNWMPPWCRWDISHPPQFSLWMNVLFAFAGAFTVANLYYNVPILNILAHDFDVPYITVSRIPTLMQAGYATGLLFICPLGDLFPRRPFTLVLVFFTASMW